MVILYGFGKYAQKLFSCCDAPLDEIEVIIDRKGQSNEIDINTISWECFVKNRNKYISKTVIIGTENYEKEIREQLIESGFFSEQKIIFIDDWIALYQIADGRRQLEETEELMEKAGEINKELLKNARVMANREDVLKEFPKNAIVAEVGVAFGDFSKKILNEMCPKKFYAIDVFDDNTTGFWGRNLFQEVNMTHFEWYKNEFKQEINKGIVETKKGLSWECLAQFPDCYFDYVYLDAAHDYSNVKKDVEELKRVVKPGGIIQFNDYIFFDHVAKIYYGTMPVINTFINETKSEVLYYCLSLSGFDDIVIKLNVEKKGFAK